MADAKPREPKDAKKSTTEVLSSSEHEVKVDANENMSYSDYARQSSKPIVTVQQIIARKAAPKPKIREFWPNMEVKQEVLWGELPKEEPPKPERRPLTSKTHIIVSGPAPKPPPKGIGSMEPPGK